MTNATQSERVKLQKVIDEAADELEAAVSRLATRCDEVFDIKSGKTQMSNLERIGLTSRRFGDVLAFVKRQTGKEAGKKEKSLRWSKKLEGGKCLGEHVLELLEQVRQKADDRCRAQGLEALRNEARLGLAGVCLRDVHSAYLYRKALAEGG